VRAQDVGIEDRDVGHVPRPPRSCSTTRCGRWWWPPRSSRWCCIPGPRRGSAGEREPRCHRTVTGSVQKGTRCAI
jgi:hypothetical protein